MTARMKSAVVSRRAKATLCPSCKSEGLMYVEDELITRKVDSFDAETGKLWIASHFDCEGDGCNPRFLCGDCGGECKIPKGLEYDFQ